MLGLEYTGWKDQASCIGLWEDFDFDEEVGAPDIAKITMLKRICNECPVFEKCAEDAIEYSDEYTFRAGMTPKERRRMLKKLNVDSWLVKRIQLRKAKNAKLDEHKIGGVRWMAGCNCKKCTLVPTWYR